MEKTSCATQLGHPGLSLASISLRELAYMIRGKGHLARVWMSHPARLTSLLPCAAGLSRAVCPAMPLGFKGLCHSCPIHSFWPDHPTQTFGIAKLPPWVMPCRGWSEELPPQPARVGTQGLQLPVTAWAHQGSSPCPTCEGTFKALHHPSQSILNLPYLVLFLLLGQP